MSDIGVPIFKKSGWYKDHPMESFIVRFYKDLDDVYLWVGPGKHIVDHDNPEYHKFLDKYGLDRNVWDHDEGQRVCFSFIEEIMIHKYTKDDSFSKQSQDDLHYVLYDVLHDYFWPMEPETSSQHFSDFYREKIADKLRKNNGNDVVKYDDGSEYSIVETLTEKAFSNPLWRYFSERKKRKNNYAWYKKN